MGPTFKNAGHGSPSLIGLQRAMNPEQDLIDQVHQRWQMYPGSAPNGTGATGLMSGDSAGWSRMLNENTHVLDLERAQQGKDPLQVRMGGEQDMMPEMPTTVWDPSRQTSAVPSSQPSLDVLKKLAAKKVGKV